MYAASTASATPVIAALNDIVGKRSRWGFWKCFHQLRSDGKKLES
jgi:hypothetical protein